MKIVSLIARLLLGLMFTVFGANIVHPFLPMPPPPTEGPVAQFMAATWPTHFMLVIGVLQVLGGLTLLSGRFANLGLTILGAIIFNILLFHILISHADYPMPAVVAVLYLIVLASRKDYLCTVFRA